MSFSEFAVVTGIAELDSAIMYLIVALIICGINTLLVPAVQWVLNKLKSLTTKFQKTPEKDGELADEILDKIEVVRNEFINCMKNLENKWANKQAKTDEDISQLKQDNSIMSASVSSIAVKQREQNKEPKVIPVNESYGIIHEENNMKKVEEKTDENTIVKSYGVTAERLFTKPSNIFGGEQ